MTIFFISLTAVAVLLLTAVPGYILMKRRMLEENCIPGLSKILLYICQPCLSIYTFSTTAYTPELLTRIGVFAVFCIGINGLMLSCVYLVLRKKCERPIYRIITIAATFGNCAFFGIPIVEAILPGASELILYTTVYALVMNLLGWTVGSAIISRDLKYISVKKIFINPSMIGTAIAFFFFVGRVPIHPNLLDMITMVGRMCTPLSMLIMGMRLATMRFGDLFVHKNVYLTIAVKQLLMPLIAFFAILFVPLDASVKQTFFIICACPVASVVLNYAEIVGEGQREAANLLLLGTMLSILTLPIMMFLLPYLQ